MVEEKPKEEKKKDELESWEKKIKSKLSSYEWRKLREEVKIKERMVSFRNEFHKHMTTFITGAFAFVAALVWRDAIQSILDMVVIKTYIPIHVEWVLNLTTAIIISFIAVIAIMLISRTPKAS